MEAAQIDVAATLDRPRAKRPLVWHNITNYVAMTISANTLLARQARRPRWSMPVEEVEDFVKISDALVVNIGTLSPPWVDAMRRAVLTANEMRKPWVLGSGPAAARRRTAPRSRPSSRASSRPSSAATPARS